MLSPIPPGSYTLTASGQLQSASWAATMTVSAVDRQVTRADLLLEPAPPTPSVDARIEVVFPHDERGHVVPVSQAPLVNVAVFLFQSGTLNPVPCDFANTVRLRWALNLVSVAGTASQVPTSHEVPGMPVTQAIGTRLTQTIDGRSFPAWIFNDVPVPFVQRSSLYDPARSKQFFVVEVDEVTFGTNVWSHGDDPRTFFPAQFLPQSAPQPATGPLDTVIQVVFPHDVLGSVRPVDQSPW